MALVLSGDRLAKERHTKSWNVQTETHKSLSRSSGSTFLMFIQAWRPSSVGLIVFCGI